MKIKATFSDGTTMVRDTKNQYQYAWKQTWVKDGITKKDCGFSNNNKGFKSSWMSCDTSDKQIKLLFSGAKRKNLLIENAEVRKTAKIEYVKVEVV